MKRDFKVVLLWAAVVVWAGIILWFSSQPVDVSRALSMEVTDVVMRFVGNWFEGYEGFHRLVRKVAHGVLYFVLGFLVVGVVRRRVKGFRAYVVAFVICLIFAVFDELYQFYVSGRGGQVGDVLIDSVGVVLGLGFYGVVKWIGWKV